MGLLKKTYCILLLGVIFLFTSCTSSTHSLLTSKLAKVASDPRNVEVFFGNPPVKSRPIAVVSVSRDGENALYAVEALKLEAAELGADGICHLDMQYSTGFLPSLRVKGIAVRYE